MSHTIPAVPPAGDRGREARIDLGIALLVVVVALAMRLPTLDRFITPDELKWVCRSVNFYSALEHGALADTLQTGHPGVLTMWVGVPAMGGEVQGEWLRLCANPRLSDAVAQRTSNEPAELAAQLFAARRGVALLTALALGLAAWLLIRLLGRLLAVPAIVMLLGDPFILAHSRLLHLDAIAAVFSLLSLVALALALRKDRARFLVLSGVCGALASLNKSPAMLIAPFTAGALCVAAIGWRRPLRWLIRSGLIWIAAAAVAYVAVWPAMWVRPWHTFRSVIETATYYAGTPHSNDNYFLSEIRPDPGSAFYPVALAFRITPWALVGALLALPLAWRRGEHRPVLWLFGAYVLAYLAFMTAGAKKFDRYILPAFGPLDVLAAIGLTAAAQWGLRRWRPEGMAWRAPTATAALLALLGVVTVLPHAPYYLTYYNPLLGGGRAAVRVLLVGWGEGLDEATRYLNGLPDAARKNGVARALPAFAAYYDGPAYDANDYDPATTHYVVLYLNEVQRRLNPELMARYYDVAEPLHVTSLHGIDYAWIYENASYRPPMEYIAAHANPTTDAIVVSRPSLFSEHYRGAVPLYVLPNGEDEGALRAVLTEANAEARRIWYVRYDEHDAAGRLDTIDFQWKTHARLLSHQSFTDATVSLWQPRDGEFASPLGERQAANARFGDMLELVAYTPNDPASQWGCSVGLSLEWRALRTPDRYYSLALYVVDEYGRQWGQGDRWIVNQAMQPTAFWQEGVDAVDRATIELDAGIPPGTYRLQAEVYDRLGRERLAAVGPASDDPVQRIDVGPLVVASSHVTPTVEQLGLAAHETPLVPGLSLVGWRVEPRAVCFDERLSVMLGWQATDSLSDDYAAHLEVLDAQERSWAEATCTPAGDAYPTTRWQPGETLRYPCDLHIAAEALAGTARLVLTLLDDSGRAAAPPITLEELDLRGHRYALPTSVQAQDAVLGEAIHLRGFEVADTIVHPGEALQFTLYWQRTGEIAKGYKVFTHLVDLTDVIRGQQDGVPMAGRYPTDRWQPDEVVADRYTIHVPLDTPPGTMHLYVGMYDPDGEMPRLALTNAAGERQPDDRLMLDVAIEVTP